MEQKEAVKGTGKGVAGVVTVTGGKPQESFQKEGAGWDRCTLVGIHQRKPFCAADLGRKTELPLHFLYLFPSRRCGVRSERDTPWQVLPACGLAAHVTARGRSRDFIGAGAETSSGLEPPGSTGGLTRRQVVEARPRLGSQGKGRTPPMSAVKLAVHGHELEHSERGIKVGSVGALVYDFVINVHCEHRSEKMALPQIGGSKAGDEQSSVVPAPVGQDLGPLSPLGGPSPSLCLLGTPGLCLHPHGSVLSPHLLSGSKCPCFYRDAGHIGLGAHTSPG